MLQKFRPIYTTLRIEFSDGKTIKLLELLEPILNQSKFENIPKLVINDFCRGDYFRRTAIAKDQQFKQKSLNAQERFCFIIRVTFKTKSQNLKDRFNHAFFNLSWKSNIYLYNRITIYW